MAAAFANFSSVS